jgi:FKBP-type peptidyl-prolyl cis-trans isomerase
MLYIPQELAYGGNPQGDVIQPFMPLIFEVELLSIEK